MNLSPIKFVNWRIFSISNCTCLWLNLVTWSTNQSTVSRSPTCLRSVTCIKEVMCSLKNPTWTICAISTELVASKTMYQTYTSRNSTSLNQSKQMHFLGLSLEPWVPTMKIRHQLGLRQWWNATKKVKILTSTESERSYPRQPRVESAPLRSGSRT